MVRMHAQHVLTAQNVPSAMSGGAYRLQTCCRGLGPGRALTAAQKACSGRHPKCGMQDLRGQHITQRQ